MQSLKTCKSVLWHVDKYIPPHMLSIGQMITKIFRVGTPGGMREGQTEGRGTRQLEWAVSLFGKHLHCCRDGVFDKKGIISIVCVFIQNINIL